MQINFSFFPLSLDLFFALSLDLCFAYLSKKNTDFTTKVYSYYRDKNDKLSKSFVELKGVQKKSHS